MRYQFVLTRMAIHSFIYINNFITINEWDFPGGPVVKNLPSNAGDTGLIPGWGTKIPHAVGQLSVCAQLESPRDATTKPAHHN